MKTLRLQVDPEALNSQTSQSSIQCAAEILRGGGLVAFPTETVYGLGANALDARAVEGIFAAKLRPAWDPLIVHISNPAMLETVTTNLPASATSLMKAFWPGPLTLLLPRNDHIPQSVTAGRPLVGVRMPAHPVAHALIERTGVPIAAPSANTFGRISPTLAAHVFEDLDGRIDAVLDSGETTHGLESTVVDPGADPVLVYRPGVISLEKIQAVCGSAVAWQQPPQDGQTRPEMLPSPGLGIRHYAPRARLVLTEGEDDFVAAIRETARESKQTGIMLPEGFLRGDQAWATDGLVIFNWGVWEDWAQLAHRLFAGLRFLDAAKVELILCPLPPNQDIGIAIRDRLFKAAKSG